MKTKNRKLHILLVEDSASDTMLIRRSFARSKLDHTLYCVEDGEKAIAFLKRDGEYKQVTRQDLIILDTRAKEEYDVSHIPGAIFVGPTFNAADVEQYEKEKTVVVYCSVGYRSEKYGAEMQKMGYDKVYNLYGGIFEWVNNGQVVTTEEGNTSNIHTYNSNWGKYVINPNSNKIH